MKLIIELPIRIFFCFVLFFETGSHYVAQAGLELAMWPRLSLNPQSSCFSILSARITGVFRHTQQECSWRPSLVMFSMSPHEEAQKFLSDLNVRDSWFLLNNLLLCHYSQLSAYTDCIPSMDSTNCRSKILKKKKKKANPTSGLNMYRCTDFNSLNNKI
jgi:hypothetical protein